MMHVNTVSPWSLTELCPASPEPECEQSGAAGPSDGMNSEPETLLLLLEARGADVERAVGQKSMSVADARKAKARKEAKKARKRAEKAREKGGFWGKISTVMKGDVATVAGAVASATAIAATGGAAAPMVLAAAALASRVGAKVAEHYEASPWLCLAMSGAGAVGGAFTGDVSALGGTLSTIGTVAQVTEAGAVVVGGGATGAQGYYQSQAKHSDADQLRADVSGEEAQDVIERELEGKARVMKRQHDMIATAGAIKEQKQRANQAILEKG